MLISGGKAGKTGAPFRSVVGHGAFVLPGLRKARYLTLRMQESAVHENCVTSQGLNVTVSAVVAFKVANDPESIVNAGQRFLSDQNQMPELTGTIFAGHLRAIVGSMTLEQIITDRQALAVQVLDASKTEMATLGLRVDSFQIQSVDDMRSGYIDAMSAPHRAAIAQRAKTAQAQADQASAEAEQASKRQQIDYARQTQVAQAQATQDIQTAQANADAEVDQAKAKANQQVQLAQVAAQQAASLAGAEAKAQVTAQQAKADQAGPLAQAQAQLAVTQAQAELKARQVELTARQLEIDVVKPAQADAQKVQIAATAQAAAQTTLAQAAASNDKIALQQLLIEKLPDIVEAAASAYAGSNVTILNGADGVGDMTAKIVAQGLAILDTVKSGVLGGQNGSRPAETGQPVVRAGRS